VADGRNRRRTTRGVNDGGAWLTRREHVDTLEMNAMPAGETDPSPGSSAAAKPASGGNELAISAEAREYEGHPYTMIMLAGQASDAARRQLREALTTQAHRSPGHLLIDLSRLTRIDPAVANELVRASGVVHGLGSVLALVAPPPEVAQVLRLAAVHDVIPLYDSVAEAMTG
jgi:anti-anti-sigma regulatory factor